MSTIELWDVRLVPHLSRHLENVTKFPQARTRSALHYSDTRHVLSMFAAHEYLLFPLHRSSTSPDTSAAAPPPRQKPHLASPPATSTRAWRAAAPLWSTGAATATRTSRAVRTARIRTIMRLRRSGTTTKARVRRAALSGSRWCTPARSIFTSPASSRERLCSDGAGVSGAP